MVYSLPPRRCPQKISKNQRAGTLKNHFDRPINTAAIIVIFRRHYYHCHNDFRFNNKITCYIPLQAMTATATETVIIMATIFSKSNNKNNNNNNNKLRIQETLKIQERALVGKS